MVESEKDAQAVKVPMPSASRKADAKLKISPGRRGARKYKIWYSLEDGGRGFDTVLTLSYRTEGGGAGERKIWNRGPGTDTGTFTIEANRKITSMKAKVERVSSHDSEASLRSRAPDILP
ncbi:hypothetical protein OIE66_04105 [Nonomuraea sp. NBC_01738]|uniref:hypothetical protein n=1 Tax=Nonomuraea sp. NBC_01738 TaxID=2976003 RepID=UPI002E0D967D|nr:hypothetical protein OIE66_04105 [Nonomuraea sp. NBC_01738]